MIFTDYYKLEKLTEAEARREVTRSSQSYEMLENVLINKRKFNIGGLSVNYVPRPETFKGIAGRKPDMALTKGNVNISSIFVPEFNNRLLAYGDINGTQDAIIFVFSEDKHTIELFIARGYLTDINSLYESVKAGEQDEEMTQWRANAVDVLKQGRLLI